MSLQYRVASILLAVFALFGALDYGVQRLVLAPSFLALEREEVQKNVDRAVQAVQREAQLLAPSATDWAVWDDTYRASWRTETTPTSRPTSRTKRSRG